VSMFFVMYAVCEAVRSVLDGYVVCLVTSSVCWVFRSVDGYVCMYFVR
jgi:hypothetical protein